MSQHIAIVKGNGREEYLKDKLRLTKSKDEAFRFEASMEARLAAEALTRAVIEKGDGTYPRLYPWIDEVDAEEVE